MDATPDTKECSKPWCKKRLPFESQYKTCDSCRQHDRDNQKARRGRQKVTDKNQKVAGQKRAHSSFAANGAPAKRARGPDLSEENDFEDEEEDVFGFEDDNDTVSQKKRF